MLSKSLRFAITLFLFTGGSAFTAESFTIDPVHTTIDFSIRHMVINHVKGRFTRFSGTILLDTSDLNHSTVNMTVEAGSLDTGNKKRDQDVQGPDFLDVEHYPTMTFQSTSFEKHDNRYLLKGKLTLHGVTREITIPVEYNGTIKDPWGNTRLGAEARFRIDRFDYGLKWNKALESGGLLVGRTVDIGIHLEAIRQKEASKKRAADEAKLQTER